MSAKEQPKLTTNHNLLPSLYKHTMRHTIHKEGNERKRETICPITSLNKDEEYKSNYKEDVDIYVIQIKKIKDKPINCLVNIRKSSPIAGNYSAFRKVTDDKSILEFYAEQNLLTEFLQQLTQQLPNYYTLRKNITDFIVPAYESKLLSDLINAAIEINKLDEIIDAAKDIDKLNLLIEADKGVNKLDDFIVEEK